jgi:imidazolonepropionase-like amidohydrolase
MLFKAVLAALLLFPAWAAECAEEQVYTVLIGGRASGKETVERSGAIVNVSYTYNDRGRGPEIEGHYRLNDAGLPVAIDLTGKDYNKAPVNEHWKRSSADGQAWYLSDNGPPSELAWLARAGGTAALLPAGTANVEKGATLALSAKDQTAHVTLYSVSGLGFSPTLIWLDGRGEFFASVEPTMSVIRSGWEDVNRQLLDAQAVAEEKRLSVLAATLGHRPAKGLVIRHVRVFDSENAALRENQQVTIANGLIASVATDSSAPTPPGFEAIDGAGKTLLPGLFDMHAHFSSFEGLLNIASGVTSIRDLGNDMDTLLRWRRRFDSNEAIGPRIFLAGVMDGRGPYTAPTNVLVDTEEEARAAIEKYAANGYIQIKIYSSIKPELVPYIVRVAHENKMRVSGHVPAGMIASQFIAAGVDEMQHINYVFLNFMPDKAASTASRARMVLVAENGAALDQESPEVAAFINVLREKQIVVDPTLGAFEHLFLARPGAVSPSYAPIVDRLPPQVRRASYGGGLAVPEGKDQTYRASFQAMLRMTRRLYDSGVPLVIGTDGLEGLMLHRELELWVQAGIPAEKVLQIATLGAARVARSADTLGSIAPGKRADLLLVEGNPVRTISDIRKCRVTIKDGIVYRSDNLYRELGISLN